ncbi:hypothetical protein TNCT_658121 [Trichonephila clavata]|uniref:Uncharacterized protein n=1 Tax=Trichonephila clavata TaxID=2740835 RepID=A0A8X6JL92_TRICU|nr:hypothetical protein TNCT_658121 [Trichonephila clavata]
MPKSIHDPFVFSWGWVGETFPPRHNIHRSVEGLRRDLDAYLPSVLMGTGRHTHDPSIRSWWWIGEIFVPPRHANHRAVEGFRR